MIIEKIALYFNCIRPFDFKLVVIWSMKHPLDVQKTSKQFDFSECSVPSSACILFFFVIFRRMKQRVPPRKPLLLKNNFYFHSLALADFFPAHVFHSIFYYSVSRIFMMLLLLCAVCLCSCTLFSLSFCLGYSCWSSKWKRKLNSSKSCRKKLNEAPPPPSAIPCIIQGEQASARNA